jgi:hypothetical protein
MKKVLIGCGIATAVIVVIFIVIGYFGVKLFKNVSEEFSGFNTTFQELNVKYPFTEPVDGLISRDRYKAWMQVRQGMSGSIAVYDSTMKNFNLKSLSTLKEHTFKSMQQYQEFMEAAGLSPDEYTWISGCMIGAMNSGDVRSDADLRDVVEAFDAIKNSDSGRPTFSNDNLESFGIPVTSSQIARITSLIREDKQAFMETIKVFHLDMMAYGISQAASRSTDAADSLKTGGAEF